MEWRPIPDHDGDKSDFSTLKERNAHMPVSLANIIKNTAVVTLTIDDDPDQTLNITYYPNRVDDKALLSLLALGDLGQDLTQSKTLLSELNKRLTELIGDWDLYLDEEMEQKAPITAEQLAQIDVKIRQRIIAAIATDIRGPEASAPRKISRR